MPAKAKSTTKAKKKSTTQAPATKDKKRSKIPIEFVDKNHPWVVNNAAWIDAHAKEDEDKWTNYVLEKCSKEFSKLDEKGCNQKNLWSCCGMSVYVRRHIRHHFPTLL